MYADKVRSIRILRALLHSTATQAGKHSEWDMASEHICILCFALEKQETCTGKNIAAYLSTLGMHQLVYPVLHRFMDAADGFGCWLQISAEHHEVKNNRKQALIYL